MTDTHDQNEDEPPSRLRRWLGLGGAEPHGELNGAGLHANGNGHTRDMRLRISEFEAATVEDVMIPRADIVAVEVSTPVRGPAQDLR
ncbi:MAG: hypothetical protein AAF253_11880 [Pseudomonadota bacterium]